MNQSLCCAVPKAAGMAVTVWRTTSGRIALLQYARVRLGR